MLGWYLRQARYGFWRGIEELWPPACVGCGDSGSWWCGDCDGKVVPIVSPVCPRCRRLTVAGRYCRRCRPKVSLTGVLAGAHFREPLPKAVKALKYRHARAVVPVLAGYQLLALSRMPRLRRAILVPVPLHPARLARRGHNQAELLATKLSEVTTIPVAGRLERIRNTPSQTGLSRPHRARNVAGAFRWHGPMSGIPIIVDDVATTGATLNAAAVACRAAGAREVWGLVVAQR